MALRGGDELLAEVCERLHVSPGENTANGGATIELAECLGACDGAPCILIDDELQLNVTADDVVALAEGRSSEPFKPVLLARRDMPGSQTLKTYKETGGYEGLRKALAMEPKEVIDTVYQERPARTRGAGFLHRHQVDLFAQRCPRADLPVHQWRRKRARHVQ